MNDDILAEVNLESNIRAHFLADIDVDAIVANHIPVGRTAYATVFLTKRKQLYAYISSQSAFTLGDIRKVVIRMGLKADAYLPPKSRPQYFQEVGTAKFQETFPGRRVTTPQDIAFYRTLAPYNPALVLISEVVSGIYQFDADATSSWRLATKFTYRRVQTS